MAEKALNFDAAEQKVKVFKALGDEIRLRILVFCRFVRCVFVKFLVALELTQPTASHHLAILENAGLVKKRKEGKWFLIELAVLN